MARTNYSDEYIADVKKQIACVEKFLKEGYPPNGLCGSRSQLSAVYKAAVELGLAKQTLHDRVGKPDSDGFFARKFGLKVDWSLYTGPVDPVSRRANYELGGTDEDTRIVALRDKNRRLEAALKEAHRHKITDDNIREVLKVIGDTPTGVPEWLVQSKGAKQKHAPEVPMVIFADWHVGDVVEPSEVRGLNAYSMAIAEKRVQKLVSNIVHLCHNHHRAEYPGIIVNLLGDFVSGELHPELVKTDEQPCIPQTLKARDLLAWAIRKLADEFGKVYCPCSAGNHGRLTLKPEFKEYVLKNWDWMIYQLLIREFAGDKRIKFDVPASNEVHYSVFGRWKFLATHGDMLGVKGGDGIIGALGPIARGEVKTSRQSSAFGVEYDYLLIGHYHQELWLPRAIVSNSMKGFDQYAHKVLRAVPSAPSQPLWFMHAFRGITARWNVLVEEPEKGKIGEWVSWVA